MGVVSSSSIESREAGHCAKICSHIGSVAFRILTLSPALVCTVPVERQQMARGGYWLVPVPVTGVNTCHEHVTHASQAHKMFSASKTLEFYAVRN